MDTETEDRLWESVGVRSIGDLPDFPYSSFNEFVAAVLSKEALLGIEYSAARELVPITESRAASCLILALSWVHVLFVPASIFAAIYKGTWIFLIGVNTAFIGMFLASPFNSFWRIAYIGALFATLHCLHKGVVTGPIAWSAFAYAASFFSVRFLNWAAWKWAYEALLRSEALTAYLWKTGNLHIMGIR